MPFFFILSLRQVGHLISRVICISLFYQSSTCFFSAYFLKHHQKFLADHIEHFEKAETALLQAWDNIKNKTLEQSKAVLYAEKLLKETSPKVNTFIERKINYSGKIAGHIKQNNNQLKVSMKVETLNDQQLEKLEKLLHEFLESPKKV